MLLRSPEEIEEFLERHKVDLERPEVYLGKEPNTHGKIWEEAGLKILLAIPVRYEDVRGNQTVPLLYQMLNKKDNIICDRAFFPNAEREYRFFRKYKIPIFGLETKHSLGEYDIVMTSLSFVMPWWNFPLMLRMSGVSPFRKDRNRKDPVFMIGGSAMFGNFAPAYPVVDLIYFGEAEAGLFPLLDKFEEYNKSLYRLQKEFDYIFVPKCYKPVYRDEKFIKWKPFVSGLRTKFRRIVCKDLNEEEPLLKPIPSYTDATMGLGEAEISRGCRGACLFCGLGWKYRPYRERGVEEAVRALNTNKKFGGSYKGVCPIAAEFAYYTNKKELLVRLSKTNDFIDPLSMRMDAFIEDSYFDDLLAERGMNQLALGVEGVSQRIRVQLGKGITEEDIEKACRIAIDSGKFKRIKFFMISNLGETWDDYEEFFALLKRIVDYKEYKKSKIKIKASWTPLFVEPATPLQYKKPTIDEKQPWKEVDKHLDALGIDYPRGGGGKSEENFLWTVQGLHMGDTRFAEAFVDTALKLDRPFYVSLGKDTKKNLEENMKQRGAKWEHFMRERSLDEVFLWDCVDRGVSKKALKNLYIKHKNQKMSLLKIRPKLDDYDLSQVQKAGESIAQSLIMVKFHIEDKFNTVSNSHWKAQIHRAFWLAEVPLATNKVRFVADRDNGNWFSGVDYFSVGLRKNINFSMEKLGRINEHLFGIKLVSFFPYSRVIWKNLIGLYRIQTYLSNDDLYSNYIDGFRFMDELMVIQHKTRYFSGTRARKVDAKPKILRMFLTGNREGEFFIEMFDTELQIRSVLIALMKGISKRRVMKFVVNKEKAFYLDEHNKMELLP